MSSRLLIKGGFYEKAVFGHCVRPARVIPRIRPSAEGPETHLLPAFGGLARHLLPASDRGVRGGKSRYKNRIRCGDERRIRGAREQSAPGLRRRDAARLRHDRVFAHQDHGGERQLRRPGSVHEERRRFRRQEPFPRHARSGQGRWKAVPHTAGDEHAYHADQQGSVPESGIERRQPA